MLNKVINGLKNNMMVNPPPIQITADEILHELKEYNNRTVNNGLNRPLIQIPKLGFSYSYKKKAVFENTLKAVFADMLVDIEKYILDIISVYDDNDSIPWSKKFILIAESGKIPENRIRFYYFLKHILNHKSRFIFAKQTKVLFDYAAITPLEKEETKETLDYTIKEKAVKIPKKEEESSESTTFGIKEKSSESSVSKSKEKSTEITEKSTEITEKIKEIEEIEESEESEKSEYNPSISVGVSESTRFVEEEKIDDWTIEYLKLLNPTEFEESVKKMLDKYNKKQGTEKNKIGINIKKLYETKDIDTLEILDEMFELANFNPDKIKIIKKPKISESITRTFENPETHELAKYSYKIENGVFLNKITGKPLANQNYAVRKNVMIENMIELAEDDKIKDEKYISKLKKINPKKLPKNILKSFVNVMENKGVFRIPPTKTLKELRAELTKKLKEL